MTPYITFRETDDKGELQYYILQREFPHYIGVVKSMPEATTWVNAPVAGHYLWVCFAGTLRGNMVPAFPDFHKEMESVFTSMAEWYYLNRIKGNEKKFKKFKIETNVPISPK